MGDLQMQPGICKIEFAMGAHGLVWTTPGTTVERVSCQARLLGVKPGWSISMIDGKPITESQQCWHELLRCKKSGNKYVIYFTKDEASIRADQQKADAERAKKQKDMEEKRKKEETDRKIREDAEKQRADELSAKKKEYWEKQEGEKAAEGGAPAEGEAAAPAEGEAAAEAPAEAPAEAAEAPAEAAEGGGEAPAEEAAPAEAPAEEAPPAEE